eukprot:TRINITY_DN5728_c0_g1_i1.p1 TRINITY_DN5728_c0_g1~~TRINITY_DN5728_c0_g1_i1.p1  ORF type:complete len:100 (-),score=34.60 TRINITY_DN5728_c0_g1_i1:88-345(-)
MVKVVAVADGVLPDDVELKAATAAEVKQQLRDTYGFPVDRQVLFTNAGYSLKDDDAVDSIVHLRLNMAGGCYKGEDGWCCFCTIA